MNPKTIFRLLLAFSVLIFWPEKSSVAQERQKGSEGFVSFITSGSIYVKFDNTQGIEPGDTLYIAAGEVLVPALLVVNRSSVSCLCSPVSDKIPRLGDKILSLRKVNARSGQPVPDNPDAPEKDIGQEVISTSVKEISGKTDFSGRLSLSSYSDFSGSQAGDNHRFRYTLSMKASDASKSRLSAESYLIFTHRANHWAEVQENLFHALKIYSLALKYQLSGSASLWAGRRINPRIANVGPVDGLQFEYGFKNMFAGLVAGFRPGYTDFGLDAQLPQYGAYIGHRHSLKRADIQSSMAFLEQKYQGKTDRRFAYFQHSGTFLNNLNLFTSFELDLYRLNGGNPENAISLTSLYLSVSYRISRKLNVSGSYDKRKNVIYYETFRNFAEEMLQQSSRQGLRFSAGYRPVNNMVFGVNAGSRFRKEDARRSNTINGYAGYTGLPWLNASLNLSASFIRNSILNGQVYGGRLSKDFLQGKVSAMVHYRWVDFTFINSATPLRQHIGEVDFTWQIAQKLSLSVNHESTFQDGDNFQRLYLNLRKKF
jgi:hypothetical protein